MAFRIAGTRSRPASDVRHYRMFLPAWRHASRCGPVLAACWHRRPERTEVDRPDASFYAACGVGRCPATGQIVQPCAQRAGRSRVVQCPQRYSSRPLSARYTARTPGPQRSHVSFMSVSLSGGWVMAWRSASFALARRPRFVALAADRPEEREPPPFAAPKAVAFWISHRLPLIAYFPGPANRARARHPGRAPWRLPGLRADRWRLTLPVRDHFPLPARAGRTGEVPLGGCQSGGECRLALPQQHAHVGSVFPGSLSFGP
jgi:hypothetical protein